MKIRTIITQDAEVDDQNSLRHFLLYANEVELLGIVQTSSKFHWQGRPGVPGPQTELAKSFLETDAPFNAPFRWTGTDWMQETLRDYAADYSNLCKVSKDYPVPAYLQSITKIGNVGYMGDMDAPTEGSELIRRAILEADDRPLYIQVWGGCNTIARALLDIEEEYSCRENWNALHRTISEKVILLACGEQDECYRSYIAESWPQITFVKMFQLFSYAYPWKTQPSGESRDSLNAEFMQREILGKKSALISGYCTWKDGKYYEGEPDNFQFGANPNIDKEWFGAAFGLPAPEKFDFLSEGDSPTYFALFPWGLRTLESFTYGGFAGRYAKCTDQFNSKGELLHYWDVLKDSYVDREGKTHQVESMWPYVADIQRDFAARVCWAAGESTETAPSLEIQGGTDKAAAAGDRVCVSAAASPAAKITYRIYPEPSASWAEALQSAVKDNTMTLTVPKIAKPGDALHILVCARNAADHELVHYQQVIITVR